MSDDLSMDPETMEAQAREVPRVVDPWHVRRLETFGCSDLPALLVALGREPDGCPQYVIDSAKKLFAVKAGLRKATRSGAAAQRGNDVEAELVHAFNLDPLNGWPRVTHSSSVPREWFPLVDRYCPRLACTPDAWLRNLGDLWNVQVKTDVAGDKKSPPWWWVAQVQGETAVQAATGSLILYGPGWASWRDSDRRKPIVWVVERDDAMIADLRQSVRVGWTKVEEMLNRKEKADE